METCIYCSYRDGRVDKYCDECFEKRQTKRNNQPTKDELDSIFDGLNNTAPLVPNTEHGDLFTKEREGIF